MKVAIIQTNPTFGDVQRNVDEVLRSMELLDADLFVLPELFNTGYNIASRDEVWSLAETADGGATFKRMSDFSRGHSCYIAYGFAERAMETVYNSAALVGHGQMIGVYRKVHLYFREKLFFEPGDLGFAVFQTPLARIGMMVCFDWIFPESARTLALKGADIIAHPANLVLPYCQAAMVTRCLENGVFVATANRVGKENRGGFSFTYTGGSQVVSPKGEVLLRLSDSATDRGVISVNPDASGNKRLNEFNDLFEDRRSGFYAR